MAAYFNHRGGLLDQSGRKTEALQSFEKALATYKKLAEPEPGKPEYDEALISTYNAMGTVLSQLGRPADVIEPYQKGLAIRERLAQAHPETFSIKPIWQGATTT